MVEALVVTSSAESNETGSSFAAEHLPEKQLGHSGDTATASTCSTGGSASKPSLLDGSIVMSMERTLFSSMQVWIVTILFGTGLMMTGAQHDEVPSFCGLGFIVTAVFFLIVSWIVHVMRLLMFSAGHDLGVMGSAVWTFVILVVLVSVICVELYFALRYPYLQRSQEVVISSSP